MKEHSRYYYKNEEQITILYEFDSENEMNASGLLRDPRRTTCFISSGKYYVGGHFEAVEMKTKIIAVDFDGCLVTNAFPDIGSTIPETVDRLKKEQCDGARVILWTCRRGDQLTAAIRWCAMQGIYLDAVNENLPDVITAFGGDTRKIYADVYLDDKAVNVSDLLQDECWRDLQDYEGFYKISSYGRIKSVKRKKMLALPPNSDGYLTAHLCKNGYAESRLVHTLVAKTFLFNPFGYTSVNHKDLNRSNNNVNNLEWCTHQQNCQHRSKNSAWTKRLIILGNVITLSDLAKLTGVKRDTLKHQLARLGEDAFINKMLIDHSNALFHFLNAGNNTAVRVP